MHRWLVEDGGFHCYACGIYAAGEGDAHDAAASLPCRPGGWEHPPYVLGEVDGRILVETCAAHPYSCDQAWDAPLMEALS